MDKNNRTRVMDESDVHGAVARMAREIVEVNEGTDGLVLMGIQRRGTQIAALLVSEIERTEGVTLEAGFIDITLYRDCLLYTSPSPRDLSTSRMPSSA